MATSERLERQLEEIVEDIKRWPAWMRREMELEDPLKIVEEHLHPTRNEKRKETRGVGTD